MDQGLGIAAIGYSKMRFPTQEEGALIMSMWFPAFTELKKKML